MQSLVVVDRNSPPNCDNKYSLLCQRPKFSKRHRDWVLPETKEQAMPRWKLIAKTIAEVSRETKHWTGGPEALARHLVTIGYHETGYSRDGHSGHWLGDCRRDGTRCRSYCLGQILTGSRTGKAQFTGYTGAELVGLDKASTKRCVETMARYVVSAQTMCRSHWASTQATGSQCIFQAYGGVRRPDDKRILARVRTIRKLRLRSVSRAEATGKQSPSAAPRR